MKRFFSLIRATMTDGMNIFKISAKKKNVFTTTLLPIFLSLVIMGLMYEYSEMMMEKLIVINMGFVVLTLFVLVTTIMTLIEGIYKSGNLLFNCKDDNLLLSLPIRKNTVLFIRIFKFYIFELMYNSIFLLPAMICYAIHINPNYTYYIVSIIALLIFPIIPILISCIIGSIISYVASKFKGKNIAQTIITVLFLLGIMYFSYNMDNLFANIASNASNINDFITKIYYPAGAYIELITKFDIMKLLEFIAINIGLFIITIVLIGRIYLNINSSVKSVKTNKNIKEYKIKTTKPTIALIKKEFSRFINSPVFITNAGFGLVLYIIGCVFATVKFDGLINMFLSSGIEGEIPLTVDAIYSYLPIIFLGFICFTSFMTSITSSMISLEGKSFNILKSLPLKPSKIIQSKVLSAISIMIPCILIGDIIIFIKFKFDIVAIIITIISSILLPLIAETIGILVNLKYPRMDAKTDTEVVKQSMSSAVSVFLGMAIIGITIFLLVKAIEATIAINTIMLLFLAGFIILYLLLLILLHATCNKLFENITV